MNILGWEINRAPRISAAGSAFAERTHLAAVAAAQPDAAPKITRELAAMPYVKATGELPVTFPTVKPTGTGLPDRQVTSSPMDDYFWELPQKTSAQTDRKHPAPSRWRLNLATVATASSHGGKLADV